MSSNPGVLKGRIYQAIFEHGPMTYEALLQYIPDAIIRKIRDCVINDRFLNKTNGKKVFQIVGYAPHRGTGGSRHPIIGIGTGPDAPLPVIENAHLEANRRYEASPKGKAAREARAERKREQPVVEPETVIDPEDEKRVALAFAGLLGTAPPKLTNTIPGRVHLIPIKHPKQNGNAKKVASKNPKTARGPRAIVEDGTAHARLS